MLPTRFVALRVLLLLSIAALASLLCGFGPPLLTDSDHSPTLRIHPTVADPAAFNAAVDTSSAPTALVYDLNSARILYARDADTPRPPASLTKLMTALLALDAGSIDQSVTVQGIDLIGDASMGLQAGEVLTLEQLLWGLLLPSGNDAAMTVARAIGGDPETFVAQMNERADALNLSATHFESPHGLDRSGQTSSARDLLRIALLDWNHPLFREIVGSASANIAGHPLKNTNDLLGPLAGADDTTVVGVKTGTTDLAGQCLVAAFDDNGQLTFVVVMGSADRFADAQILYRAATERFAWFAPNAADFAALNRLPGPDGEMIYLAGNGAPPILLDAWQIPLVHPVRLIDVTNPEVWDHGAVIGRIEWRLGSQLLTTEQLVVR